MSDVGACHVGVDDLMSWVVALAKVRKPLGVRVAILPGSTHEHRLVLVAYRNRVAVGSATRTTPCNLRGSSESGNDTSLMVESARGGTFNQGIVVRV